MSNLAIETYKSQEEELLKKYPGQYVWIAGKEVKGISKSLVELIKKADKANSDPQNTIIRKIEEEHNEEHSVFFMG